MPHLEREMRAIAVPILADVRQAARNIPSHGAKHTGARAALAKATTSRVRVGDRTVEMDIVVDPGRMPAGQQALPAAFESEIFFHPVYGQPPTVPQRGHPWARVTVQADAPKARAAVQRAADRYAAQLSRRGS
jgi:hypothetical protein